MPKNDLAKLYCDIQSEMCTKLQVGSSIIAHTTTKGDNTEADWISWFKNYLPKRYNIDKGIVIDSKGMMSQQIDVIIYDSQYSYFVFHHNDTLLIPAESVYAVFEVKQNLNKDHIEYAGEKAKSVRELYRTSAPIKHAGGEYPPKPLHRIIAGLLTTVSDWSSPIENKVVEYLDKRELFEQLDLICSITNNTFVVNNKNENKSEILFCKKEDSLVYFFLNLLKYLQDIATVPAIDILEYASVIDTCQYKRNFDM